jgi:YfiH family protein
MELLHAEGLSALGIKHGFTTRALGDVRSSLALWEKASGLSAERLVWAEQVHGSTLLVAWRPPRLPGEYQGRADALTSNISGLVLAVRTADCLPLLLYDPGRRAAAAVHCGWRGALARAAQRTVEVMEKLYGCQPRQLLAVIGPHIRPSCYPVGPEVGRAFLSAFGPQAAPVLEGRPRVDLARAVRLQLEQVGVNHIEEIELCTFCQPELFFSWRREGESCGHQLAYICVP